MHFKKMFNAFLTFSRKYSLNVGELQFKHLNGHHTGITLCGLNRPQQKNAMSIHLLNELTKVINKLSFEEQSRVLVIHSLTPGVFCAGADLKERSEMDLRNVQTFVTNFRSLINKIYNMPIPTIAAIDGVALGGGLELALACDIRIASCNAKMGLVETKLAIMPGAGGTQLLPRITGISIAKEMIYTAKVIDAKLAEKYGIINHLVDQNEDNNAAFQKALQVAELILPNGPLGIKMAKKAINKGSEVDFSTGLAIEEACYAQLIPTKDRTEGLKAFREKRKPIFSGH